MFFSKKEDISLINMENKISVLKTRMDNLELTLDILKNQIMSLRGLVNRKLGSVPEDKEDAQSLNNPVILPDHGAPFRNR